MVRFLHTGDWQLGMTRHFLSGDAQARYSEARLDAVRHIAELARVEDCSFVVVSGDVFESNHLDRQVVVRSLDAMATFDIPLYLLPGNHDPVNAGSVYRSATFRDHCPEQVVLLDSPGIVAVPGVNVELVAAPLNSKQPLEDLVAKACTGLSLLVRDLFRGRAPDNRDFARAGQRLEPRTTLMHEGEAGHLQHVRQGEADRSL